MLKFHHNSKFVYMHTEAWMKRPELNPLQALIKFNTALKLMCYSINQINNTSIIV